MTGARVVSQKRYTPSRDLSDATIPITSNPPSEYADLCRALVAKKAAEDAEHLLARIGGQAMSTDHRQEAADMLDGKNLYGSPTEALAHATLALVEQQRITNELRAAELMVDKPWLRSEIERLGLAND